MKKNVVWVFLTLYCFTVFAQSEIATVNYQKTERLAIVNELPFAEKTITKAIDDYMGKSGYKGEDNNGFTVYKFVKLSELGSGEYDLYFKAERKSRRNKDNSTLSMIISLGFEKFITAKDDRGLINNAKKFLDNLFPVITAYDLELQISGQEEEVKKAGEKNNALLEDGQRLEKKRKTIEKEIEDNKKELEKQLADIEKQKLMLETLKTSRKQ